MGIDPVLMISAVFIVMIWLLAGTYCCMHSIETWPWFEAQVAMNWFFVGSILLWPLVFIGRQLYIWLYAP